MVFPGLLWVIVAVKIVGEIRQTEAITLLLSVITMIALFVLLSSLFYILLVHLRK